MLFSVVVPIYKVEQYIDRCVESLIKQTYRDIEIILVDDGSPDNCPKICDEYAEKDNRIKVIHKKNGGLSDARNAGIEVATGKYVFFVDSDDYISQCTFEDLLPFAETDCDIIIGDGICEGGTSPIVHFAGDKGKIFSGYEYYKHSVLNGKMPMAAWLNGYKKSFLIQNGLCFKYGLLHEDEQFTPRAFLKAESVIYSGVEFYRYIIREDSITTKKDKRKNVADVYATCCELKEIYDSISHEEFRQLLLDSLVNKYLNIFQVARAYKYGKEYIHKAFVIKNSYRRKTRMKAALFTLSPRLYYFINSVSKKL